VLYRLVHLHRLLTHGDESWRNPQPQRSDYTSSVSLSAIAKALCRIDQESQRSA
jgi:hypothetical protein